MAQDLATTAGGHRRRRARAALPARPDVILFAIAFLARLIPVLRNGGFSGDYGYDASVYYAAADGLTHGRVPYRDYVLLHPPGVVLADLPFAFFGRLAGDQAGFVSANVVFGLIAAGSAVLVVRVARRLGLPYRAALVGGLVYALWFGSVDAEYLARLEPLGNVFLLCALLAWVRGRAEPGGTARARWTNLLCGVAFGCAVSVKLWWVVPFAVVVLWTLVVERAGRRVAVLLAGTVVAVMVVDGPFLLLARSRMWQMVVLDQLGRPADNNDLLKPFGYLVAGRLSLGRRASALDAVVILAAAAFAVLVWRAWRVRSSRVVVVILLAQLLQLATEPSWFTFYADFLTVPFALVVASAFTGRPECSPVTESMARPDGRGRERTGPVPALVGAFLALTLGVGLQGGLITPFPRARLTRAVAHARCVMSDSPMGLIEVDALSRSFDTGCRDLVDVTGLRFELRRMMPGASSRSVYVRYDHDLVEYLRHGQAALLTRSAARIGLGRRALEQVTRDGVLAHGRGGTVYRTVPPG